MFDTTICAISTAVAPGAIGIVRLSGAKAVSIANTVFRPKNAEKSITAASGYTSMLGDFTDNGEVIDQCIAHIYKAPHSFTGEDIIEFSCHGGVYVLNRVLHCLVTLGATPACAGEFTKRAFLNGKLNLSQAESVISIITAENELELKLALDNKNGSIVADIEKIKANLVNIAAQIAVYIDYPEDDVPDIEQQDLDKQLNESAEKISEYINNFNNGKVMRSGINCAIVGKPNVGKSTFMNKLLKTDRSIVTEIAGTTRDIIEDTARLDKYTLKLNDTAGIRSTNDIIENIGIEKSKQALKIADLVLFLLDSSVPFDENDSSLIDLIDINNTIFILNKTDLTCKLDNVMLPKMKYNINISAKYDDITTPLTDILDEIFVGGITAVSQPTVLNQRQNDCLQRAYNAISEAVTALKQGITYDIIGILVEEAINYLLELTGQTASEFIVNEIFDKFCVGK